MLHFIACGNDAAHVFMSVLWPSTEYSWLLMHQLRWSKNFLEHCDCPHQIMMWSVDPVYFVLLGHAVFLEDWIEQGQGRTQQWIFTDGSTKITSPVEEIAKEVKRCKGGLYKVVKKIVGRPFFLDPAVQNLGYKLAITQQKNCNHTQEKKMHAQRLHGLPGMLEK
jgi:hypothetical protein